MSSRQFPSGDSRYTSRDRDRSPPYRLERRGSITSGPTRNQDNSYRPSDSNSNTREVLGAPRGPSGRGNSYSSRGGNYIGREGRGGRDASFYRSRDSDRDFQRRDNDRRPSPNRNRSRTPPSTRDFRDARDNRDAPSRLIDTTRINREARESGPLSAVSVSSEAGTSGSSYHRNTFRSSRGRGDWDRVPGRRNFEDRDSFRPRSRSRDRWDRDHDRGRDHDRDSRREDDSRDRDSDRVRRDPPVRPDSRNSVTSQPISVGGAIHIDRKDAPKAPHFVETPRRASFAHTPSRSDLSRRPSNTQTPSSPIQYPQVPEFGVIKPVITSSDTIRSIPGPSPKDDVPPIFKNESTDPTKIAPRGPKADLASLSRTTPKGYGRRPGFSDQSPVTRRFENNHDTSSVSSPVVPRFGPSVSPPFAHTSTGRSRNSTWTSPELVTKSAQVSTTNLENRSQLENDAHRPADIRIPTGPKADRDFSVRTPSSARSTKTPTTMWANPNRQTPQQHKPSIMQSMHSRKDDELSSRISAGSPSLEMRPGSRSIADGEAAVRRASSDMMSARRSILSPGSTTSAIQGFRGKDLDEDDNADADADADVDAMDDEDEEDEDEEDAAELDQQDFEKSEIMFKKQIESLQRKLAPEPSMNPKILAALESIHVYASAIEDYKNGYVPPPKSVGKEKPRGTAVLSPTLSSRPSDIPTPPAETTQTKHEDDKVDIEESIDLPLDGLIYLDKNPLTPASFDYNDIEAEEDDLCDRVRHTLALDKGEDEDLREIYAELYLKWREEIDAIDEENAQQEAFMTRAATPMSVLGTETATTPVPDGGRRSTRNATEMDLERVIKESAEEAQAAEMAHIPVDMSVDSDMTREAEIPDMLTEGDQEIFIFEDLNNRVPNTSDVMSAAPEDNPVFKAYDYLPLPDNFDSDDQERFMDAYAKFPKQWGFLANNMNEVALQVELKTENQALPKLRNYHQCILHYYMTKKQAKPAYKLLPNRKSRTKKKTTTTGPRKPNQRSSMLGGSEEGGTRISDTGRPKRAAAPSFNDKEKREAEALAQKAALKEKKASTLLNKPAIDGASGSEKTPKGKRKKGDKTPKRVVKTAGSAPNILPAQNGDHGIGGNVQIQNAYASQDFEGAQLLAELSGYAGGPNISQPPTTFAQGSQNETWRVDPRVQASPQPSQMLASSSMALQPASMSILDPSTIQPGHSAPTKENIFPMRQLSPQIANQQAYSNNNNQTANSTGSRAPEKTSSYWSVPESNLFEDALRRHGRDWSTIASYLPSKTETMCENFFKKGGKDPEAKQPKFIEIADEADQRNAKEGPPPPLESLSRSLPPSSSTTRRRGAPTSQRAIAPNPDPLPEAVMPASTTVDTHSVMNPNHAQGSSQNISNSRIVPAHPVSTPAAAGSETLSTTKVSIPPQTNRTQTSTIQAQTHTSPYAPHIDLDRHRNAVPTTYEAVHSLQLLQSKRPRSISEQDRHLQEHLPKRQSVVPLEVYKEFTKELTLQHEQQQQQQTQHVPQQQQYAQQQQAHVQHMQQPPQQPQQQQRNIHRSDSQQGYEYRQPQPVTQAVYPPLMRTTSGSDEFNRYPRPPSPNQYHKEREAYPVQQFKQEPLSAMQQYKQESSSGMQQYKQEPMSGMQQYKQEPSSGMNSMAAVMSSARGFEQSPRQHAQTELPRPSSIVSMSTSRSTPAPLQKRSNIMSLLNNDLPEEKKVVESRPIVPIRHDLLTTSTSIHQPTPQPVYPRRELLETARENLPQRGFAQPVFAAPASQSQSYNNQASQPYMHPSQHQLQPRDSYQQRQYYPETGRSHEAPRQMYSQQSSSAISPPPAQESPYHVPRPNYDMPSHAHVGPTSSHSRAASYSMHSDSSGPSPSPYKSIRPSNPSQPMGGGHHQPASLPQHSVYQGPTSMTGSYRATTAYPGHLSHEPRRIEDQSGLRMYSNTPSHTPPIASGYGSYPPPPPPPS